MLLKVQCEKCKTKYKLDDARIQGKGAKITCPRCRNVFVVMKDAIRDDEDDDASDLQEDATVSIPVAPSAPRAPVPPPAPPPARVSPPVHEVPRAADVPGAPYVPRPTHVDDLSWKEVGLTTFKVKVAIGLVYDFSDVGTLKKYIADKRVVPTDRVSFDGKVWHVLKDIPVLDDFFIDQWVSLKQERLLEESKKAPVPKGPTGPVFGEPRRERSEKKAPPPPKEPVAAVAARPSGGQKAPEKPATSSGRTAWSADAGMESASEGKGLLGQDLFDDIAGVDDDNDLGLQGGRAGGDASRRPLELSSSPSRSASSASRPTASSSSSASTAGPVKFGRFEMATLLILVSACGYLGWKLMQELGMTPLRDTVELSILSRQLDELIQQNFPIAYGAAQGATAAPAVAEAPAQPAPRELEREPAREREPAAGSRPPKEQASREKSNRSGASGTISVGNITAQDLYQLGQQSLKSSDYDGAIASFQGALQMKPDNENYQYALGYTLFQAGRDQEAETELKKALELGQSHKEANRLLGDLYARQGRKQQAIEAYKKYLEASPRDGDAIRGKIEKLSNS